MPAPKAKKAPAKRGRPSPYDPQRHPDIARALALAGSVDRDIARLLGVSERTLNAWKKHPEFLQALKGGKDPANERIKNAVFRSAEGEEYTETKTIIRVVKGKEVVDRIERTTKQRPPNMMAANMWLNSRDEEWRHSQRDEIDLNATITDTRGEEARKKIEAACGGKAKKGKVGK